MLRADGLAAIRGERLVFERIGFAVAAAGALVLTGPNGAGKSTLLRLLAGLVRPAAGGLWWQGEDALADRVAHGGRVAYVGQPLSDVFKDFPWFEKMLKETIASKQTVSRQETIMPIGADEVKIGYTTILINDPDKRVLGAGVIFQRLGR